MNRISDSDKTGNRRKTNMDNEEPNPGKIFETTFAFTTTRVLITAIDLELFTHIARGNHTVVEIAKAA